MTVSSAETNVRISVERDGWNVIVHDGSEALEHLFLDEGDAHTFASRERKRLGLTLPVAPQSLEGEAGIISTNDM